MTRRLLSVSSSRADVGILTPVWQALSAADGIDLHVLFTGMHRAADGPLPDLPKGATGHTGGEDMGGGADPAAAAAAMAASAAASGELCAELEPDLLLVIGDRLDMIPAALASLPFNIPIVHMAGGDVTLGAIDDRVRHALTKLSHVHCVINVEAAYRIARMGEEAWRIHVTGGTGLDMLQAVPVLSAEAFAAEVNLDTARGLRLVTVHPETNSDAPAAPLRAILPALDGAPAPTLFTAPNSDPAGRAMREDIEAFVAARPWAAFRDTLGARLYANAMRQATVMLGNSSSGIVEAALFGLNVINVGRRQEGRVGGANVYDCPNEASAVAALLARLNTPATGRPSHSIYGDGRAAPRVARVVRELPGRSALLNKKFNTEEAHFTAPWATRNEDIHAAG
jgi:UDP-hydrolysing UDP-N-acetyl-D-glucosamine 2-epimerase